MDQAGKPYALKAGEGWVYNEGVDFVVKARGLGSSRFAVLEHATTEDEWPGHTHRTEDEAFFVLKGSLTFRCGDQEFDVDEGGFVFLPSGVQHGYKLRDGELAAKPIIDIQISVADLDPLSAYQVPLEKLGYVFRADNPELTKGYFREPPGAARTHIHVRRAGSWAEQFALLFRDYVRSHPE